MHLSASPEGLIGGGGVGVLAANVYVCEHSQASSGAKAIYFADHLKCPHAR